MAEAAAVSGVVTLLQIPRFMRDELRALVVGDRISLLNLNCSDCSYRAAP